RWAWPPLPVRLRRARAAAWLLVVWESAAPWAAPADPRQAAALETPAADSRSPAALAAQGPAPAQASPDKSVEDKPAADNWSAAAGSRVAVDKPAAGRLA